MFSPCIMLSSIWFILGFDVLVLMSSLQWYLSKSVTGNGVLLQFLREIIPQWMDLIVRTFVVYLAWFYSAPSQFHTFSSSRAFQNGSFSVPLLIFFLPSFALSWLSHVFFPWCWGGKHLYTECCPAIPIQTFICLRLVCQLLLVLSTSNKPHTLFVPLGFYNDYVWNKTFHNIQNVSIMCTNFFLFQEEILFESSPLRVKSGWDPYSGTLEVFVWY